MNPFENGVRGLPPSIAEIRELSVKARERLIRSYLCATAGPVSPPYLESGGIVRTHLRRSAMELARPGALMGDAAGHRAYTLLRAGGYSFSGESGALSELCIGVMGKVLRARGELHVAAGFFSTMVACVDDYLDREGSYRELGGGLLYISHCYRDLMDMALEEQVSAGALSGGELAEIRLRLFDVIKTLAGSEAATDARRYLYEKSCGDKVIGVLFPSSEASAGDKRRCAEIGRLVGEAGQLIDDIIDYESDIKSGARNYISHTGSGVGGAIEGAARRVSRARAVASGLRDNCSVCWVLDALEDVVASLESRRGSMEGVSPWLPGMCASFKSLVPGGSPADSFLVWF